MRIVSWNCNGKCREKFPQVLPYDADVYIFQECEDPARTKHAAYRDFAARSIWTGVNKNRGLGVFFPGETTVRRYGSEETGTDLRHFLPLEIGGGFRLLAVWAARHYVEMIHDCMDAHPDWFCEATAIVGDWNSNAIWDYKRKRQTHTFLMERLAACGLFSQYHEQTGERSGSETQATFYMYRHPDKPYHIDYCCTARERMECLRFGAAEHFLQFSDHLPLVIDIKTDLS